MVKREHLAFCSFFNFIKHSHHLRVKFKYSTNNSAPYAHQRLRKSFQTELILQAKLHAQLIVHRCTQKKKLHRVRSLEYLLTHSICTQRNLSNSTILKNTLHCPSLHLQPLMPFKHSPVSLRNAV